MLDKSLASMILDQKTNQRHRISKQWLDFRATPTEKRSQLNNNSQFLYVLIF